LGALTGLHFFQSEKSSVLAHWTATRIFFERSQVAHTGFTSDKNTAIQRLSADEWGLLSSSKRWFTVTGANGIGKSYMLKRICDVCNEGSGPPEKASPRILYVSHRGYVPAPAYFLEKNGVEKISTALHVRDVMAEYLLQPDGQLVHWLSKQSTGTLQRLCLAAAILEKPDVLVLDESCNAVDNAGVYAITSALAENLPDTKIITVDHSGRLTPFSCEPSVIVHMESSKPATVG